MLDANALHTFTSPDGAFLFKYSDLLVHCIGSKNQAGLWEPVDSCESYFPVCDDPGTQCNSTLVCFSYPSGTFEDPPTFDAATFSLAGIRESTTGMDCLIGTPDS